MRVTHYLVLAGGVVVALLVLFAVPGDPGSVTTYGAASAVLAAAGLLAGVALLVSGALDARVGPLAIAVAVAWWAPDLVGWEDGSPVVRSVAAVVAPFLGAVVLHLAVAFPRATPRHRSAWALVATAYIASAAISLSRAAFRDPFEVLECWSNCTANVFLVRADRGIASALDDALLAVTGVLAIATVGVAVGRATRTRALWLVLVPCALVALGGGLHALALALTPAESPERADFAAIYLGRSTALIALAAGLAWGVAAAARRRAAVARLGTMLGPAPAPGRLATVLAGSLRDPDLQVGYWLPEDGRVVDAHGRTFELPAPDGRRTVTRVVRRGEPVAAVVHDSALLDGPGLEREIGAAVRLAVDNERLQAVVLAQLADLRASRSRIVERADTERRRLERDLHDGAQQRLLALLFELRLARAAAAGDPELERRLATAAGQAESALGDLRDLAHGIFPLVLAEAGLGPALATLADTAAIPVELTVVEMRRYDEAVETAAYAIVARALEDAARRGATVARVAVQEDGGRLLVEVGYDAPGSPPDLLHFADRAGALGGRVEAALGRLLVELPCVS